MKDKKTPYIGIITSGSQECNFYLDNYVASFMKTDSSSITFDDSFIYGVIFNRKNIAIYKGKETLEWTYCKRIKTNAYIVAVENCLPTKWDTFDYIEFIGGTLKGVFPCSGLAGERQGNKFIHSFRDDSKKYAFKISNVSCSLEICSITTQFDGFKRKSLSNDNVRLLLRFDTAQPLEEAFTYIHKVKELLSFMVSRKNVGFDEIFLYHNQEKVSKMQVYLDEDYEPIEKDIHSNITFHDLRDSVGKLATIIFNNVDQKPSYELDFIPESDKDVKRMSDDKIRLTCSSLECELAFIQREKEVGSGELQCLIDQVKNIIKEHRESPQRLEDKTYDLILSSIRHWSMSASERFCELYHHYADEMRSFIAARLEPSNTTLSDEDINAFVKYRNHITHGSYRMITPKMATTAFILQGLVYCCILSRIGLDRATIRKLCSERKFLA